MAVDPARAKSLFLAASDLTDPAERAAYLDRECAGDATSGTGGGAAASHRPCPPPASGLGDGRLHYGPPPTEDHGDPTARVGSVVAGKYKLIEEIGEGGMGSVYLAQQTEPVKRAVAVKVIKAGMDSKAVLVRFEAERQALAMMDHPNIAKVLDAGTTEGGRPFFVMEWLKDAHHPVLRRPQALAPAAPGTVRPGMPGHPARPPEGGHPPRHQTLKRPGGAVRRPAGAEGD
jgi:hypothetical protein